MAIGTILTQRPKTSINLSCSVAIALYSKMRSAFFHPRRSALRIGEQKCDRQDSPPATIFTI
ncbi:hypothetical protein Q5692_02065 [Microcoleus sp. C2C3]|uniref:hypothetical protein n=1 Tax=unclassified Microcoleus TaxID=2642155 RepID=UPI002FD3D85D